MAQALFYPWIDIRDDAWLKTSLLYWDSVRTIVPESIDAPYSTETGRALEAAGFLIPLRVHSGMDEIEQLADAALAYVGTPEAAGLFLAERGGPGTLVHTDKLSLRLRAFADRLASRDGEPDWLRVDEKFADFYMTLLATKLAERIGAGLLTPLPAADRLAIAARLDAQLNGLVPAGSDGSRHWQEHEAFGPPRRVPMTLARGMLAHLAIERMAVAVDTPLDQLLDFRERHRDELALFRTKVEQLVAGIDTDQPIEAMRQRIADLHDNEVAPAITNLKRALAGRGIRWFGDGLHKIACLSAASSSMLVVAGLSVPTALLAGAGVSAIVSATMYNVDKHESLRANPYTYLLSVGREL